MSYIKNDSIYCYDDEVDSVFTFRERFLRIYENSEDYYSTLKNKKVIKRFMIRMLFTSKTKKTIIYNHLDSLSSVLFYNDSLNKFIY